VCVVCLATTTNHIDSFLQLFGTDDNDNDTHLGQDRETLFATKHVQCSHWLLDPKQLKHTHTHAC